MIRSKVPKHKLPGPPPPTERGVGQIYTELYVTVLHSYFAGIDVTALLRAFHPCIEHPRAISSTPGSRYDVSM